MVMTILEAHVAPDQWAALQAAYRTGVEKLDAGIVQTFLVQGSADPGLWRIMTVWSSLQVLDEMRRSKETPRGVLMFRAAGVEPALSVFDVVTSAVSETVAG